MRHYTIIYMKVYICLFMYTNIYNRVLAVPDFLRERGCVCVPACVRTSEREKKYIDYFLVLETHLKWFAKGMCATVTL